MTPERLRDHFAGRGPNGGADAWADMPSELTRAAVLVPIVPRDGVLTAIFTQRTDHLDDHPGQVSFPGGRAEPGDTHPVATALRETEEEIGLGPRHVEILGCLRARDTATGFAVTPVIGLVSPPFTLTLDDFEVAAAFEVPLDFLFDPANHRRESVVWRGRRREYYAMDYQGRTIWGVTARMVVDLYRELAGQ